MQPSTPSDPMPNAPAVPTQPTLPGVPEAPLLPPATPAQDTPHTDNPSPSAETNDVSTTTNITAPEMADDGDLIEKEWVSKVKHVMHSMRDNPFERSKQFTALKADYMQKRYGKTIKTED